ncbi:MAG: response regulator [Nitrosopumilales archaeon CG15_BIG_FIL_POST_REV_8_21_14_020_37_12]|nr:MAG: response regulator [Nitrosopumilales archaeon CG15_BIG_FIL_POST_REV_8_21_14_020_37_12]
MSDLTFIKKELTVLIIDDNEQITKMISTFLRLNNHKCIIANDGEYGLEILQKEQFNVILLDLAMPELDGYEILEKIRSSDKISKIIILTASNITKENQQKFKEIGIKTILQKPVDIDVLLEKITTISKYQ